MSDLHHLSAVEQLALMGDAQLSSVELTEHYLGRIEAMNEELGAFITVAPEAALAAAREADRQRAAGTAAGKPLLGLPVPIKDLSATAGMLTTFGSGAFADYVPVEDSWTVGLIRAAGAVITGKTNVPEFGPTCYTENDLGVGPAVTPYDLTRYASGSSGGAAAAVAAGLAPVAHGSDGAGSVRTPAGACGLVGFKPSRGTVSMYPQVAFASVSVEGPLARSVEDAALLADVMTRPPVGELWPDPRPIGASSLSAAARIRPESPLRVAWWTDPGVAGVSADPAVVAAVGRVAAQLADAGHQVTQVDCPAPLTDAVVDAIVMRFAMAIGMASAIIPPDRMSRLRPLSQWFLARALRSSAADVAAADLALATYGAGGMAATADFDVLLCPTTSGPPVEVGWFSEAGLDEEPSRMIGWSCGTPFANISGYCALSLPLAWTDDALPIGVQLAMPPGRDHELFSLAGQVMAAAPARLLPPSY